MRYKIKITPNAPKNVSGLPNEMGKSIRQIWVNSISEPDTLRVGIDLPVIEVDLEIMEYTLLLPPTRAIERGSFVNSPSGAYYTRNK